MAISAPIIITTESVLLLSTFMALFPRWPPVATEDTQYKLQAKYAPAEETEKFHRPLESVFAFSLRLETEHISSLARIMTGVCGP